MNECTVTPCTGHPECPEYDQKLLMHCKRWDALEKDPSPTFICWLSEHVATVYTSGDFMGKVGYNVGRVIRCLNNSTDADAEKAIIDLIALARENIQLKEVIGKARKVIDDAIKPAKKKMETSDAIPEPSMDAIHDFLETEVRSEEDIKHAVSKLNPSEQKIIAIYLKEKEKEKDGKNGKNV